jgi:hypothetical protein
LDAETSTLTMAADAVVTATDSSVRLAASGNLTLGKVVADDVSVVSAAGSIINGGATIPNVSAVNLRLSAAGAIGANTNHVTIAVDTLTAASAGTSGAGIYLTESDTVTVDTVSVTVRDFTATATTVPVTDASQSDLVTSAANGNIVLVATTGNITLNDGTDVASPFEDNTDGKAVSAHGTGSVLIDALAGSVTANADISSTSGHLTLKAGTSMDLTATVDVSTAV